MANWVSALPFSIPFSIEELEGNPIEPRVQFDEERDKVVGEMSDDEKLVFSLWQKTEEEAKRAALDAEYGRDEETRQEAMFRCSKMTRMSNIFQDMCWLMILEHLRDEHKGLRLVSGFHIIETDPPTSLIDALFNGRRPEPSPSI